MVRRTLQLLASGALLLSGCLNGTETDAVQAGLHGADGTGDAEVEAAGQAPIALRAGAMVGGDEIDGYSDKGIGVYLSVDDSHAMLTVYVVTPAESAVFMHPTLHLTTQQGDRQWTQDRVFENVTLKAGESRTFAQEADGPVMNVEAEVSAL